jgi:hypothetical protein
LGRGTDTEIHCNSVPLANENKLSSSNDSLLSNPSNQSQLSNSSMVGFPSSNVMDDQQGVVKSNTVDGASVMYPRQCSQPTAQLPSQQQTQVRVVSFKELEYLTCTKMSRKWLNDTSSALNMPT